MERSHKTSKSNGVCERLYKAVSHASLFRKNGKVSHHQNPAASNFLSTTSKPYPHKTHHVQSTKPVIHPHKPADSFPINFVFSSHPGHGHMQTSNGHMRKTAAKVQPEPYIGKNEDIPKSVSGLNQVFSAYIERVKDKMDNDSNMDSESKVQHLDGNEKRSHLDDRVNEFIQNAKIKIRTTSSSLGTAHSFSYKSKGK